MTVGEDLVVERRVGAPPATVFSYFADAERWMRWQGTDAEIELVEGGTWRVNVTGDGFASGRVVEVVENRRVAFTWGWEEGPPVAPGSTTVVIELFPDGDGTLVRLTHKGLPDEQVEVHRYGWEHYASRLAAVADGRDPGPNAPGG
ncbi:MAG TPA: SRPBCC family protein [Actinomycetota bacterium]|nr:SRPBCC family protein [Actinomycetota bacterium]